MLRAVTVSLDQEFCLNGRVAVVFINVISDEVRIRVPDVGVSATSDIRKNRVTISPSCRDSIVASGISLDVHAGIILLPRRVVGPLEITGFEIEAVRNISAASRRRVTSESSCYGDHRQNECHREQ